MTETRRKTHFGIALRSTIITGMAIWIIHVCKAVLHLPLGRLGIYPRDLDGLKGVIFAPLIHGDWAHLMSNTGPLLMLTFTIIFFYRKIAFKSIALIYVLTGLAVWVFARQNFHIGASGVVYGMVSFVFWLGVFRRNAKSIILALIILFLYSGLVMGILPNQPGVSWESHLFGGVVGILVAFMMRFQKELDEKERVYDLTEAPKRTLFDADVFERKLRDPE